MKTMFILLALTSAYADQPTHETTQPVSAMSSYSATTMRELGQISDVMRFRLETADKHINREPRDSDPGSKPGDLDHKLRAVIAGTKADIDRAMITLSEFWQILGDRNTHKDSDTELYARECPLVPDPLCAQGIDPPAIP